jgi:hypothetical protein
LKQHGRLPGAKVRSIRECKLSFTFLATTRGDASDTDLLSRLIFFPLLIGGCSASGCIFMPSGFAFSMQHTASHPIDRKHFIRLIPILL